MCPSTAEPGVLEAPIAQAGQALADGIDGRVCVHVEPDRRRALERALRVRLASALDDAEIEMPNAALDVYTRG